MPARGSLFHLVGQTDATWAKLMAVYLQIIKPLRPYLTPAEYLVLMFIFERTCSFKKLREKIPLRHFMHGVRDRRRQIVTTRIGLSKAKLLEALRHLQNKGVVYSECESRGGASWYEIVPRLEIDYEYIQRYVTDHQQNALRRKLLTNKPTYNPFTGAPAENEAPVVTTSKTTRSDVRKPLRIFPLSKLRRPDQNI